MGIIDFIIHIDVHLGELIAQYGSVTYGILFAIIFAETGLVFTPFLPGDSLLFAAGMFAANGSFDPLFLAGLLMVATLSGDNVNYWVGRYFGQKIVNNKVIPIKQAHIDKTQAFMDRYGGKTIFLARFMPIVRTFAPFVAGTGKMEYRKFLLFSIAGCVTWVCGFVFTGYFFGNIPVVHDNFSLVVMGIIVLSVTPALFEFVKNMIKKYRTKTTS
ncbi:MAG: DedA family protein [Parcubacteria group bacterium]